MIHRPSRKLPLVALSGIALAGLLALSPARAQQPSAPHLAAAREVVTGSGIVRSIDTVVPQLAERVKRTLLTTRPEIANDLNAALATLKPELEAKREEMLAIAAKVYAGRMSEKELREVATFFKSDVGKTYVAAQPLVLDDLLREMQVWSGNLDEFVITRVREEMRKKGIQL